MTKRITQEMKKAIEEKVFPGAALLVASKGEVLYRQFFGHATLLPKPETLQEKTIFDIASLTKPVATASLFLMTMREKGLSLNSPASKYLRILQTEPHRKISIRHLLRHTSGLPAWKPYFQQIAQEHPGEIGQRSCRNYFLDKISREPLESPVAFKRIYSDLGYIVLGILLENLWEMPLEELFRTRIALPLDLKNTFYIPIGSPPPRPIDHFAATEKSEWRQKVIRGEVHDDNAYTMGGIAGHAGLFSHVDDLHRFLSAISQGYRNGHPLFLKEALLEFIGPEAKQKLGWDTPSTKDSQAGNLISRNAIGHLGYSGCSFWLDLDRDYHVILLTNRVHPTSQNEAIKQFRPKIHDLIFEELIKK